MLTDKETHRYASHLLLKDVGQAGQLKLKAATVTIIGLGGLGSPVALYLAAAGVGKLILVDGDVVEMSNLQRQIIYKSNHIGQSKVDSTRKSLFGLNSLVEVQTIPQMVNDKNIDEIVAAAQVVVDCTDNYEARYIISQACVTHHKPLISGAAIGGEGQLLVCDHGNDANGACYHCLYPPHQKKPATNCANSGVFGPILGIIGSMQALETIKYLVGKPLTSAAKLLIFDGMNLQWQSFTVNKRMTCEVCGFAQ